MQQGRKTALVTGAARGIGRAIAADLATDHDLAFTWHAHPPDETLADCPDACAVQADLADPGAAREVIDTVMQRFGRLDVIVNNAGAIQTTPLERVERDVHRHLMDLHVTAPAALLEAALAHLKPGAAIVNISSINAVLPPMGAAIYGASKAAQDLWMRGMAKELGPRGIRVNSVAPGAVNTPEAPRDAELTQAFLDLTALGRLATPQDIAAAVRFLASDAAGAITGEVLKVSGGYRF
ncbi:SDR family oxidoreductase [Aliishimia ponticola]|uniref:SDR family oxidoreductase n=1 Tax=Aliishimia ponticola TaxID=2499833 RepID=A0A4S4NHV2_9RHOB|nr:SDR family oxidoreductase [Aliishimia ponticola]THH38267.1 SDR family oxidoreductase [Aliishimia ponticola]